MVQAAQTFNVQSYIGRPIDELRNTVIFNNLVQQPRPHYQLANIEVTPGKLDSVEGLFHKCAEKGFEAFTIGEKNII